MLVLAYIHVCRSLSGRLNQHALRSRFLSHCHVLRSTDASCPVPPHVHHLQSTLGLRCLIILSVFCLLAGSTLIIEHIRTGAREWTPALARKLSIFFRSSYPFHLLYASANILVSLSFEMFSKCNSDEEDQMRIRTLVDPTACSPSHGEMLHWTPRLTF